ncbi:MAG: hypothetical protein WD716_00190 [Fimbriimonadaceae bacterium]
MGKQRLVHGVSTLVTVLYVGGLLLFFSLMFFQTNCACGGSGRKSVSLSNLKQAAIGHEMYVADNDGFGPSPKSWVDQVSAYMPNKSERVFASAHEAIKDGEYGHAYFRPLGDLKEWAVQNKEEVPLMFDSTDLRRNANGGLELLPDPPRWGKVNLMAFLDGHVKAIRERPRVEIILPTP